MISIVIVSYNSKKYLDDCLSSIFNSTYKKIKVILVDNNSSDGSAGFVKQKFPQVNIIVLKENLGFAGANNHGIKFAQKLGSEYVFLLNPDTVLDEKCLELLINKNKNSKHTILQPLILICKNSKKTDLINTTGNCLNFLGISYCNDYKKPSSFAIEKEITIASGAAAFVPIEMFNTVGYFDEKFFLYHEDVDLFWRARLAGFNIKLTPKAKVWHDYTFSKGKNKYFYIERNRLIFLFKNFSLWYLLVILPIMVINEILMLLYSISDGWFIYKLKSYISIICLTICGFHKNQIQPENKNSIKNLKHFIIADIFLPEMNNLIFLPYNLILRLYWKLIYPLI